MILKWIFDRLVSFIGLCFLWPILLVVAILVKVKMPDGPAVFVQKRVGRGALLHLVQHCVITNSMNCLDCGMC